MIFSISQERVFELLKKQLSAFFFLSEEEEIILKDAFPIVMSRVEKNFSVSPNKYFVRNGEVYFNPYHSGQWLIFLYYMSYELAHSKTREPNTFLADRVYYLNKIMNGCDLFYDVVLPDYFGIEHPVGTVIGRGKISNGFFFYQGCVVGGNHDIYPIIEENCRMYAHSAIIGDCHIGKNVLIGAHCQIKDQSIPDNSIVFGQSPNLIIKENKHVLK